jgi:hypothetical protein
MGRSAPTRLTPHEVGQILAPRMVARLELQVEVVGCPTICRHCWAQGISYPAMPVEDVAWVLEPTRRFCDDHGLGFSAYPMHEVAAHPQAAELLRVFADHVGAAEFEPLSTTGVPLAIRQDWLELLAVLQRLQVDEMAWEPAVYYPTPRGRRNQRLRPQPSDLLPLADRIRHLSPFHRDAWANLEAYTEAAWVARPLAGDWPAQVAEVEPGLGDQGLQLVCRPGLEPHTGVAGRYREGHGNLRRDGGQAVLSRALAQGGRSIDAVWFGLDRLPAVGELAARYGDRAGQGLHFIEASVRYLWLDRARRAGHAGAVASSRRRRRLTG